ncbi:hypothetical protein D9611_004923 [Ephemerocybe angulata]|uniref:XPG-I domain-containing protein n=1 Tax=Ephemerocybe angulata TaxID=980116 RepID=A0A8H5B3E4_9AGAR|nr:hypothetical protein D9611_004923 [Tulosesus angulatus]
MGIEGLWQAIAPAADHRSLTELLTTEALKRIENGERLPVVGVDASPLMFQAQGVAIQYRFLVTLLEQWIQTPALFHIVFDGPHRPPRKRGRAVRPQVQQQHYLTGGFRELIDAFGFTSSIAPGEAEAELALMNVEGHVDYVLTPDSDIFLFGALNVIRPPHSEEDWDHIEVYTPGSLQNQDPGALSQAGILFLAVVAGGDYNPVGLEGCGFVTAYRLAQTTDLPQMLERAAKDANATEQLARFRNELQRELLENPHLESKRPSTASKLASNNFPDPLVVCQYANPTTSASTAPRPQILNLAEIKLPNSVLFVCQACRLLQWKWPQVLGTLDGSIWPGHCMREIIQAKYSGINFQIADAETCATANGLGSHAMSGITQREDTTREPGASPTFKYYGVKVRVSCVKVPAMKEYERETGINPDPKKMMRRSAVLWIPAPILSKVYPELVFEHLRDMHRGRRQDSPVRVRSRSASPRSSCRQRTSSAPIAERSPSIEVSSPKLGDEIYARVRKNTLVTTNQHTQALQAREKVY